ncbi:MAG: outer membrane lipoprotein carrier protein LolA [Opitutaceae bacterium]|nr:outer membrane lipoprotein carrier protein LolA [Opitutaceae bacterium]
MTKLHPLLLAAALLAPAMPVGLRADTPAEVEAATLDPEHLDAGWRDLFATLAGHGAVASTFTERRWFSVRKEPVVLRGELRHSPERGLSLRYTEPEEQLMIIDAQGILLRNAAGRSRALKSDPRAPQIDALLLPVLRFDLAALDRTFEIRGTRDGSRWRLDFTPRTPELARTLGQLAVSGEGATVRQLAFSRGPKQRVEVAIETTQTGASFSADEMKRFFR